MRVPSSPHHGSPAFKSRPHLDPRRKLHDSFSRFHFQTPEKNHISPTLKRYKKQHESKRNLISSFRASELPVHPPMRLTPSPLLLRNLRNFIPGRDGLSYHLLKEPGMIPPVFDENVSQPVQASVLLSLQYSQEWVQGPLLLSHILSFLTAEDLGHLDLATIDARALRVMLKQSWEHLKTILPILQHRKYF
jgi:hypothetical protein